MASICELMRGEPNALVDAAVQHYLKEMHKALPSGYGFKATGAKISAGTFAGVRWRSAAR